MSEIQAPASYPHRPIHTLLALSRVLGYPLELLQRVAETSSTRYRRAKAIKKPDGTVRQPFDALFPLKEIQIRIKQRILSEVIFPAYLTGSLKGQDQVRNATLHCGAVITVCEDIKSFFPNTSSRVIFDVWRGFFGFSDSVATLLTGLTTKDGSLPQGAVTSSHLANLAFWRREPSLHAALAKDGVTYSRYVDDITLSSRKEIKREALSHHIARVYGMMASQGYRAHRGKQEIQRGHSQMLATKLLVNRHAAMTTAERQAIRTAVYLIEQRSIVAGGLLDADLIKQLDSTTGRVGRLARMHRTEGRALQLRLKVLRAKVTNVSE